ncbi:hypothetical protein [Staphylococcus warneri]|uniref:hypothetical protein n=1 Tax=Staphylococcus warneri TaxID=1292 RepID=UPI0009D5503F|nr:hypothetical protein [Staphylococcus warneri]MCC8990292.1 hypothetical protein [Staphylococcus sp.]SKR78934.1 Uncharacterised protein [Mycobacteroides abscessus subsp. abscessus]MBP3032832.1 hypothetical protein [Staphylococcus warneri]MCM3069337.1 hypothetical protein [Staphylococcus warneri]MCR1797224.1 hypothetical protein [Staphylococcus warneri]
MDLSIILIILGAILIIISKIVMYADEKRHELKEKFYLPGLCLVLIGILILVGHFVTS